MIDSYFESNLDSSCLVNLNKDSWVWYKHLTHVSMDLVQKLFKKYLVLGLLKLKYIEDKICEAC